MNSSDERPRLFQEIIHHQPSPIDLLPDQVEAYIFNNVPPKQCGKLLKDLGYILPLIKSDNKEMTAVDEFTGEKRYKWALLGHLRRVRRVKKCVDNGVVTSPPKKKQKGKGDSSIELQVLVGSVEHVDALFTEPSVDPDTRDKLQNVMNTNELKLEKRMLPGRPAKSQEELQEWNNRYDGHGWWPTLFFEKQSNEFKEKEMEISIHEEYSIFKTYLQAAIQDAKQYHSLFKQNVYRGCGAVVVDPESNRIVSISFDEFIAKVQEEVNRTGKSIEYVQNLILGNPLNTPVMLAIQGVSRIERNAASGLGMDSDLFQNGQYLCTGYDVYLTQEPSVFESMSLVHSRVRRVIFGVSNMEDGGLGGTGNATSVHCLPGTNHRYRAFRLLESDDSDLLNECRKLLTAK